MAAAVPASPPRPTTPSTTPAGRWRGGSGSPSTCRRSRRSRSRCRRCPCTCEARKSAGRVVDGPGLRRDGLPSCRSAPGSARCSQAASSMARARAAHLHHGVVPGGHDLAGLALGRVPGGRDVVLRPLEHDQRVACRRRIRAIADWRGRGGRAASPANPPRGRAGTATPFAIRPPGPAVTRRREGVRPDAARAGGRDPPRGNAAAGTSPGHSSTVTAPAPAPPPRARGSRGAGRG